MSRAELVLNPFTGPDLINRPISVRVEVSPDLYLMRPDCGGGAGKAHAREGFR